MTKIASRNLTASSKAGMIATTSILVRFVCLRVILIERSITDGRSLHYRRLAVAYAWKSEAQLNILDTDISREYPGICSTWFIGTDLSEVHELVLEARKVSREFKSILLRISVWRETRSQRYGKKQANLPPGLTELQTPTYWLEKDARICVAS